MSLALTLPAALALGVAGDPIMLVLFGRGAFGAQAALLSSQALAAYAFGLPAFVAVKVLVPAFFAHGDTATPVKVGFFAIGLNLVLNLLFMVPLRHMGPALATSLSAIFNVIALGVVLSRRGRLVIDRRLQFRLVRMAVAAFAMAVALILLQRFGFVHVERLPGYRWAALAGLVGSGLATYAVAGQVVGAFDVRELLAVIQRRRRRLA
jgi:putative peptidoglycan lipid II flippase